jgi:alkylated DNA repair dioxygenase AlkB
VAATLQPTLFDTSSPAVKSLAPTHRTHLDRTCWIDRLTPWLTGSGPLFADLAEGLRWQHGSRPMYDRIVDVPRLIASVDTADFPLIEQMRLDLGARYGIGFDSVLASHYRNGRDSVAWHADRIGQTEPNPIVVIVSLGSRRDLLLRPMGGGPSTTVTMDPGDLMVMGGATQHRWEHCIPKRAAAGPRMSLTFRHNPEPKLRGESYSYIA